MIKNEKQYKISKKKVKELTTQIEKVKTGLTENPLRSQVILATLTYSKKEIENEVSDYESLKESKKSTLKAREISALPTLITEYKILFGLTQKELAEMLGLKEQQLQRYESDNFKSVSFRNLLKYLDIIGLEVSIKGTRIKRTYRAFVKKNP